MAASLLIKQIFYSSWEYKDALHLRDVVLRQPLGLDIYKDDLTNDIGDLHIAAFLDSEIVGTLILRSLHEKQMKMRQVAVNQEKKGEGIGAKMVAFSEEMAKGQGYLQMILHARKEVVPFYQKQGYSIIGEEFFEIGIPHLKMQKNLV